MLRSIQTIRGSSLHATDGDIGAVDDMLFDDERWAIRYLVANTGDWLLEQLVLLSPHAIQTIDWDEHTVAMNLTRQRIENSPDISTDRPVSRQKEDEYAVYYGYTPYWLGPDLWGASATPLIPAYPQLMPEPHAATTQQPEQKADSHLRSAREVHGYHILASDGEIGHVSDFLFDEETWSIRTLVVDTSNWLFGTKVLVPADQITGVDWGERQVRTKLSREQIKNEPEYRQEATQGGTTTNS